MNKKKILVVVDYQVDFVSGVLPVPEADTLVQNIQREINSTEYENIIYTFDTHTPEDYKNSEESKIFPDIHCEFNTEGWNLFKIKPNNYVKFNELVSEQEQPFQIIRINNEAFFCKDKFDIWEGSEVYPKWFTENFDKEDYQVVVTGVALNYCDFLHVMGLVERGYTVTIKEDCVKGITHFPDGSVDPSFDENIRIMKDSGVVFE